MTTYVDVLRKSELKKNHIFLPKDEQLQELIGISNKYMGEDNLENAHLLTRAFRTLEKNLNRFAK